MNSVVRQIYKYSNGGTKKPKKAAAKAFGSDADAQFKGQNTPVSSTVHRISELTSAVTSAVPTLLKLLSRHD